MAEGLFRKLVEGRDDYEVLSAGVGAYAGDPISTYTGDVLREAGIDSSQFRSKQLTPAMLKKATHVIGLSQSHIRAIESMFPQASDKTYLASEFTPDDALRGRDVTDPYGGDRADYDETRDVLTKLLPTLLAYIDQTFEKSDPVP